MSILIDFSQIAISNLFANIGYGHKASQELPDVSATPGTPGAKTIINEDLIRHMVLNSLRMYHMKFGEKYGNLIICCDSNHYWRKDVFPYYKSNRKKNRDNSGLDWNLIFNSLNKIRDEIDIFLPDNNLAIEFNGLYWHSTVYKNSDYHLNKTELCEKQGIQLMHIWEDDWLYKQDIIKSIILNKINATDNINSTECEIKEIDNLF